MAKPKHANHWPATIIVVGAVLFGLYNLTAFDPNSSQAGVFQVDPSSQTFESDCAEIIATYQTIHDELQTLLEQQERLLRALDEATTEQEKASLRLQLWALHFQIQEKANELNTYMEAYSECFKVTANPNLLR